MKEVLLAVSYAAFFARPENNGNVWFREDIDHIIIDV